jgi:excisionase family DNA binding protein
MPLDPSDTTKALDPNRLLLDVREVATALHIGRSQVYSLIAGGDLRPVKLGRLTRIPLGDLHALVARKVEETRSMRWPLRPGMP